MDGGLNPGDRLPPERELAEQFGVSRTAVREAVKALTQKGLVVVHVGRGTFVTDGTSEVARHSLGLMMKIGQEVGWLLENEYVEAGLNAAIEASRLPVIAACNGYALGGGAVLALACDIRMAAESAVFGFPEVKVGVFASGSGTQRLPRLVGRGRALDLLMTGRTIGAEEALRVGLVEYVVPDEQLLERAQALASQIAANSAPAVAVTKQCVNTGLREGFEAGLAQERKLRVETGVGADAKEGREAFLEKRPPKFTH